MDLPFAEDMNYWKSGKSAPDKWLDSAEDIINKLGGEVHLRAIGRQDGRSVYCMNFSFGEDRFKAIWPVLPTKKNEKRAAERQASTMLFHDVKSRSLRSSIFGPRVAFFDFLLLENGKTTTQLTNQELLNYTPQSLLK